MARETRKLTRFELEVMNILWRLGKAAVREIQEEFPEGNRPAYTTVQTIVRRLEEKGAVRRVRKIGNAFVFEPVVSRVSTIRRLLDELLSLVDGSPKPLVAQLVETGNLTVEDLQEMEELIEANQTRQRKTGQKPKGGRG
jgi:predicted transcriptional regulator